VVKANAYGHGLLRAAAALGDLADGFALLDLDEAVTLREAGIRSRFSCSKASSRPPIWPFAPSTT
jgi:alanine racemase